MTTIAKIDPTAILLQTVMNLFQPRRIDHCLSLSVGWGIFAAVTVDVVSPTAVQTPTPMVFSRHSGADTLDSTLCRQSIREVWIVSHRGYEITNGVRQVAFSCLYRFRALLRKLEVKRVGVNRDMTLGNPVISTRTELDPPHRE